MKLLLVPLHIITKAMLVLMLSLILNNFISLVLEKRRYNIGNSVKQFKGEINLEKCIKIWRCT